MGHQVYAQRLSFDELDDAGQPTGNPEIVYRGGKVPGYVPTYIVNALLNAGMIVPVADDADPVLTPADEMPAQVRTPDHPLSLQSDRDGAPALLTIDSLEAGDAPTLLSTSGTTVGGTGKAVAAEPVGGEKPKVTDSKATWEAYASSPAVGMDRAEAESMTKATLISEVNRREADQQ